MSVVLILWRAEAKFSLAMRRVFAFRRKGEKEVLPADEAGVFKNWLHDLPGRARIASGDARLEHEERGIRCSPGL